MEGKAIQCTPATRNVASPTNMEEKAIQCTPATRNVASPRRNHKAEKKGSTLLSTTPSRLDRNYLQFYGFALNEPWVMQFARANLTGVSDQNYWCILSWVIQYLRRKTQHSDINVESVKIDGETPANATVYEGKLKHVTILCICEFHKEAWPRRPTLAQVKQLTEIMGTEPRWWTDLNSLEFYE